MPNVLVGLMMIVLGLIACFYGYPLARILFALAGLVTGYLVGIQLVPPDQWLLAIAIGVVIGLICAALAYPLWSIGIVVLGAIFGFALFFNLGVMLQWSSTALYVVGIIGAILVGALFFVARDLMIKLCTAFSGASYAVYGLTLVLPQGINNGVTLTVLVLTLGLIGFLVQYGMFKGRHLYASVPTAKPQ